MALALVRGAFSRPNAALCGIQRLHRRGLCTVDPFGHEGQAQDYAVYRPAYNKDVFSLIDSYVSAEGSASPPRKLAVDVGCGTGQVSIPLRETLGFDSVLGVDRSTEQLRNARSCPGVEYIQGDAYALPVRDNTVDIITIAQTMHWLDENAFFAEAKRALRPGGVLCVLGYSVPRLTDDSLQRVFRDYYENTLGSLLKPGDPGCYWDCDRTLLDSAFARVEFSPPFEAVVREEVVDTQEMSNLDSFYSYMSTMSAYRAYLRAHTASGRVGERGDPLIEFREVTDRIVREQGIESVQVQYPYFVILARA